MIAMSLHNVPIVEVEGFRPCDYYYYYSDYNASSILNRYLLMQMVYTRRQQNDLSTRTTPPPPRHLTCQLYYHVKPFPVHQHCTILQFING